MILSYLTQTQQNVLIVSQSSMFQSSPSEIKVYIMTNILNMLCDKGQKSESGLGEAMTRCWDYIKHPEVTRVIF